jgi:hypothetical protein
VLAFCFILFQHGDLFYTSSSSYAYLHGHIFNFYDYNKTAVGRDDYLPLIYVIFAAWNMPLKLLGLMHDVASAGTYLTIVELVWTKLLLVAFYFATAYVMYLIGKVISNNSTKAKWLSAIFASSPIAVFAVFIFGQYDIIGIFFTMLGFYYYVKDNRLRFSLFFSLAISVKYFALIPFLPLLLLKEKRILPLLKYILISLAATLLQIAAYWNNASFRASVFGVGNEKATALESLNLSGINNSPYLVALYAAILLYAYIKEVDLKAESYKSAVYIALLSYAVMFSTVYWHPQWLIIIVPFFALSTMFVKDAAKSFIIDTIGMFAFVYIFVNCWNHNVDSIMLHNGVLRSFFPLIPLYNYQLFIPKYLHIFMGIFFIYLISPILIQIFEKYFSGNIDEIEKKEATCFRLRFYVGLAFFVIPSVFCALATKDVIKLIDPSAYPITGLSINLGQKPVGYINRHTSIKQSFVGDDDKLLGVDMLLATWGRKNKCDVTLNLLDKDNIVVATQNIDGQLMADNSWVRFSFPSILNSKGKRYFIEIKSNGNDDNSISAWQTNESIYTAGQLFVNDNMVSGDLCLKLLYGR